MKMKDLNPADEGEFHCKLQWNLMVSKIGIIVLLLL